MKSNRLGQIIRKARLQRGLRQIDLAIALKYTTSQFISNFERGRADVPLKKLPRLISLFNLDAVQIRKILIQDYEEKIDRHLLRTQHDKTFKK